MARDDDGLQRFFKRMGIVEGDIYTIKSTLDLMVQEIKLLSLKIDDRSLTDGTYRSGHDR